MCACRKIQFTRVAQPDDPSAVHSKIVEKTKSHANNDHRYLEYILSVILLMKNNILRAYISIEMATFQKKVNHALSLQRLKRFF